MALGTSPFKTTSRVRDLALGSRLGDADKVSRGQILSFDIV